MEIVTIMERPDLAYDRIRAMEAEIAAKDDAIAELRAEIGRMRRRAVELECLAHGLLHYADHPDGSDAVTENDMPVLLGSLRERADELGVR